MTIGSEINFVATKIGQNTIDDELLEPATRITQGYAVTREIYQSRKF